MRFDFVHYDIYALRYILLTARNFYYNIPKVLEAYNICFLKLNSLKLYYSNIGKFGSKLVENVNFVGGGSIRNLVPKCQKTKTINKITTTKN